MDKEEAREKARKLSAAFSAIREQMKENPDDDSIYETFLEVKKRLIYAEAVANRPEWLVPGTYEVVQNTPPNPLGDGRSNKSHWRGAFQKTLPIPAGFRFVVLENGEIKAASGRDSLGPGCWEGYRSKKAWVKALVQEYSKPVTKTPMEKLKDRIGSGYYSGYQAGLLLQAAANLGVNVDAFIEEVGRLHDSEE